MILEFSVANYLSIKDRLTLSLVASSDKNLRDQNVFKVGDSGPELLKSAAIYGANASGKTNLYKALSFMRSFVLSSASERQRGDTIHVTPFKLDPDTVNKPSYFEITFIVDKERYVYGFTVDKEKVYEEWLTAAQFRRKPRLLFRRYTDGSITFGASWRGERQKVVKLTRPDALFLSVLVQFNNAVVAPVFDWFNKKLRTISNLPEINSEIEYTIDRLTAEPNFVKNVVKFLKVADLGIHDLSVETIPITKKDIETLPTPIKEMLHKMSAQAGSTIPDIKQISVYSSHKTTDGSEATFDLQKEESAGTIRLFSLAGPWLHVMKEGCILLVDELEAKLHPLMTRFLIEQIHHSQTSQLVFTTHDCGLLDSDLFRRDQVWFTEKQSSTSETRLYSLWDFDVRSDANFRNGYLKGRYGAIPFIGEFGFEDFEE